VEQTNCTNNTLALFLLDRVILEQEPKTLDAWSWSRNPKFEFGLHSSGQK